jgi:uncharacterized Tic20 family protein
MRARQEQVIEAFCHLSNAIPIWGLFFCGVVWFWLREESRSVVRQARDAMVFHSLILVPMLLWCFLFQVIRLVRYLAPAWFCELLYWINNGMLLIVYIAFALVCLWGMLCRLRGEPFRYPFPRRRV